MRRPSQKTNKRSLFVQTSPDNVVIICNYCSGMIESPVEQLVRPHKGIVAQGLICSNCGNILVLDDDILSIIVPARHRIKNRLPKKKLWKIINKGKYNPENAPRPRRSSAYRKVA